MSESRPLTAERVREILRVARMAPSHQMKVCEEIVVGVAALLARTEELAAEVQKSQDSEIHWAREAERLAARTEAAEKALAETRQIAGFFASVARCGEAWSAACDEQYEALAGSSPAAEADCTCPHIAYGMYRQVEDCPIHGAGGVSDSSAQEIHNRDCQTCRKAFEPGSSVTGEACCSPEKPHLTSDAPMTLEAGVHWFANREESH